MRRTAPDSGTLPDGLTRDHRDIAFMIDRMEATDRNDLWRRSGPDLRQHIRAEERTLFPMCEARLSQADLEMLGREFRSLGNYV
jgi:hypothetical protein